MKNPVTMKQGLITFPYLSNQVAQALPEVELATHVYYPGKVSISVPGKNLQFLETRAIYADSNFFKLFNCWFLIGVAPTTLAEPNGVVLTVSSARRLLGTTGDVGQIIEIDGKSFTVTGIIEDAGNSHLKYELVLFKASLPGPAHKTQYPGLTYVMLREGSSKTTFEEKLNENQTEYLPFAPEKEVDAPFVAEGLSQAYFHGISNQYLTPILRTRDVQMLRLLALVGCAIFFLALFNHHIFMKTRSLSRIREMAIRRIHGASSRLLRIQILAETFFMVTVAALLALVILFVSTPYLSTLLNRSLDSDLVLDPSVIGFLLILIFCTAIIGAWLTPSHFGIVTTTKLAPNSLKKGQGMNAFKAIALAQFSISLCLICFSVIVSKQMHFVSNRPLGFEKDRIVELQLPEKVQDLVGPLTLKNELLNLPQIEFATLCQGNPLKGRWIRTVGTGDLQIQLGSFSGDADFARTFSLNLLQGRYFNPYLDSDTAALLVNETAAKLLDLNGELVPENHEIDLYGHVVGVVEDFNYGPLKQTIGPILIGNRTFNNDGVDDLTLDLRFSASADQAIESISQSWNRLLPNVSMDFSLVSQDYIKMYDNDFRQAGLLNIGALTAVVVNLLGFLGLMFYLLNRSSMEMAVRKVCGATSSGLLFLHIRRILTLILLSGVMAVPIAFYLSNRWLEDYVYKISFGWKEITMSLGLLAILSLVTVIYHTSKLAFTNPIKSLRNE